MRRGLIANPSTLCTIVALGACLSIVGCAIPSDPPFQPHGYKYFQRFRDVQGQYYDGTRRNFEDVAIFVYDIRPTALDEINSDREKAARIFIERRNAVPPECTAGFRVARLGTLENGAVVVTIECS